MRPPALSATLAATCLVLAACNAPPSSSGDPCDGANCADVGAQDVNADAQDAGADTAPDATADAPDDATADAPDDAQDTAGDASDDTSSDATPDSALPDANEDVGDWGPCDGRAYNACGGCDLLPNGVGSPCGECGDGAWECDGENDVTCVGDVRTAVDWWPDADEDGYGDEDAFPFAACDPPTEAWADNNTDCVDTNPGIHPNAVDVCDGVDQNCDGERDNVPDDSTCRDACCDDVLTCLDGACVARCEDGERCGESLELCCEGADICYADACAEVDTLCDFTEDCALDEICEPSLGICLPRTVVPACEFVPPVGDFEPQLDCRWTADGLPNSSRGDVVGTPVVVNVTDDDGNGVTDANDIPEIAFLTYDLNGTSCCNSVATLRVVSGLCNEDGSMDTLASISSPQLTNDTGIAAADLDGDGVAELIALTRISGRPQGTVAFTRSNDQGTAWEVLWHNEDYPSDVHTRGGAVISVANLDAAGAPEIIIGSVVLNGADGTLAWDGRATGTVGDTLGGVGNNAFLGPSSAVADIDLDGYLEVSAGNSLFEHDGTLAWTYEYDSNDSACDGNLPCDGFTAIGNFDDDDEGEIVSVRVGEVYIWNHDGSLLWRRTIPSVSCRYNESGPPTIADFDGDGLPEIGTASADYYVVLDPNTCDVDDYEAAGCSDRGVLWRVRNKDCSSRATGSSVFDFEGDGRAEVVYADETKFRIFDGLTGAILYEDTTHGSHTRIEMPVVVDVDNDGNAEIVIPENGSNSGRPGVDIWSDSSDNWVRTRRVWNQHGYAITHINEDGTVPVVPEINWLNPRLNSWRQNTQPAGIFDAPDLAIKSARLSLTSCPVTGVRMYVTVANEGALSVPAGAKVRVEVRSEGALVASTTVVTETRLFPGDETELTFDVMIDDDAPQPPYTVTTTVDPDEEINECVEDNNHTERRDVECYR